MMRTLGLLVLFATPAVGQSSSATAQHIADIAATDSVTFIWPIILQGVVPFDPPETYREIWSSMESCVGVRKPFEDVRWYVAQWIFTARGPHYAWGVYWPDPPEIVLHVNPPKELWQNVVRHEILHHLLGYRQRPRLDPVRSQGVHSDPRFQACVGA